MKLHVKYISPYEVLYKFHITLVKFYITDIFKTRVIINEFSVPFIFTLPDMARGIGPITEALKDYLKNT